MTSALSLLKRSCKEASMPFPMHGIVIAGMRVALSASVESILHALAQSEEAREDAELIAEERGGEFADAEAALDELEAQEAEALDLLRGVADVQNVRY